MRLAETVTFGGSRRLDRAAPLRTEPGAQERLLADPGARVLPFWRGKPLLADAGGATRLRWLHPQSLPRTGGEERVFLGLERGAPRFAIRLADWPGAEIPPPGGFADKTRQRHPALPADSAFAELRTVMAQLSPADAALSATARGLFEWHASHGFCARCGAPSQVSCAGWQRQCPTCGAAHFPRTDPVVIMLVTHGNDVLLGRSPGWPEGMFSLLAGFVEPGETLEAAVRRETFEETGVVVGAVDYLASQPWPFPASLMIGCRGTATGREIRIDPAEIAEALWVSREDAVAALAGAHPRIAPPRDGAIARFLLTNWLADRLD